MRFTKVGSAIVAAVLGCVLVAGCGSSGGSSGSASGSSVSATTSASDCPTENSTSFAKTKFVLHAGLAFGTFHRYIYNPYKAGKFAKGADGKVVALVKAGATALFVKRELRLAYEDVQANPSLCKVIAGPLRALSDKFGDAKSAITKGDGATIDGLQKSVTDISSQSSTGGVPITESTDESQG